MAESEPGEASIGAKADETTTPDKAAPRAGEATNTAGKQDERRRRAHSARDEAEEYSGASAPQMPLPTWKRRLFIDRPADLLAFVAEAKDARVLAIDTEFIETPYRRPTDPSHKLTLLQFAFDNDYRASYVVDALRLADLSPLQEILGRAETLKLFHDTSADKRVLATRGLVARQTLDLEAVSRSLFGGRASGLQAMLLRATGVRMDKSLQRADWGKRPLTSAMVAYAARDAEMTYTLYLWLKTNYPDQVARYIVPASAVSPDIASWLLASLEGGRSYTVEDALEDAGLTDDLNAQEAALRQALGVLRNPQQRAKVLRFIGDLALTALAPDVRPYLASSSAEERSGAARTLGKLRDKEAVEPLKLLITDPTPDVRQATTNALTAIASGEPPRLPYRRGWGRLAQTVAHRNESDSGTSGVAPDSRWTDASRQRVWTSESAPDEAPGAAPDDWRAALRARFGGKDAEGQAPEDPN